MHQVLLCSSQGIAPLSDVLKNLVQDHSASVRTTLYTSIGDLLFQWTPVDRYSCAGRVLPVLFTGTADELDPIRYICRGKLDRLGVTCSQDLVDAGVLDQVDSIDQVETGMNNQQLFCSHLIYSNFRAEASRPPVLRSKYEATLR